MRAVILKLSKELWGEAGEKGQRDYIIVLTPPIVGYGGSRE